MKRLLVVLAATALTSTLAGAAAAQAPAGVTAAQDVRAAVVLKDGWRFRQDDAVTGAERAGFDDSAWATVSVPHTWNRVGYYIPKTADRVNTPETVNKAQGAGWYRLTFTPGAQFNGKRAWLQFDAASRTAEVWLNGVRLGAHAGGFSRFRLDATAALKPGQPNLLVVKTDNSKPEAGSPTADVLPLAGDFFVHGGLYRPVSLIATDDVHIDMLDHGGPGVYAATTAISGKTAQVDVTAKVRNDARAPARLTVVARLVDAAGATAAEQTQALTVPARGDGAARATLNLADAHLWQGVEDPYLYRLVVEVRDRSGLRDRVEQAYGVRQMAFDPQSGLQLNGKPLRLHGVGLHQDVEGKGWAMSAADIAADFATIREMGANTIRLTHYQHGQPIHDLADRYGLILWDEIPLVSAWTQRGSKQPTAGLVEDARQQLTELIRQNGNHASVAVWGIANEVDFGNSLPAFVGGSDGPPPDPMPLLKQLNDLAKAEDPSRPTALATCCEGRVFGPDKDVPIVAPAADMAGANRYYGWYYGQPSELRPHLDALRADHPGQPLAVTEYGAGGAVTMHTDDPSAGPADSRGRAQPEEYMSWVHEQSWASLKATPYLWATWLWNSFDFATTVRREGDADDINTKGLVTYDRKIRKDPYFFYKANWSAAPTVHITGRRYVDRAYRTTDVRVYSNAPSTELSLNGRPLGAMTDCPQMICVWKAVRLDDGDNRLVATGRFTSGDTRDEIAWTLGADAARNVRIDSGALLAASSPSGKFGSDAFFEGGAAASANKPADYGKPAVTAAIAGAANPAIAASYREGDFHYRIPLEKGRYRVTLTFVEPSAAAGERQFDVLAGGRRVLRALDVAAVAGGPLTAVTRSFPVQVNGGAPLDLHFAPTKGKAVVSSVEIEPQ